MRFLPFIFLLVLPFMLKAEYGLENKNLYEGLVQLNKQWTEITPENKWLASPSPTHWEDLIHTHLSMVEAHLRANTPKGLNPQQFANRLQCLDILHEYNQQRQYPLNIGHLQPTPYFIDYQNTACAVGHLMREHGAHDLAMKIAANFNNYYIEDMPQDELLEWAEKNGFTLFELKWTQPGYISYYDYVAYGNDSNCGQSTGRLTAFGTDQYCDMYYSDFDYDTLLNSLQTLGYYSPEWANIQGYHAFINNSTFTESTIINNGVEIDLFDFRLAVFNIDPWFCPTFFDNCLNFIWKDINGNVVSNNNRIDSIASGFYILQIDENDNSNFCNEPSPCHYYDLITISDIELETEVAITNESCALYCYDEFYCEFGSYSNLEYGNYLSGTADGKIQVLNADSNMTINWYQIVDYWTPTIEFLGSGSEVEGLKSNLPQYSGCGKESTLYYLLEIIDANGCKYYDKFVVAYNQDYYSGIVKVYPQTCQSLGLVNISANEPEFFPYGDVYIEDTPYIIQQQKGIVAGTYTLSSPYEENYCLDIPNTVEVPFFCSPDSCEFVYEAEITNPYTYNGLTRHLLKHDDIFVFPLNEEVELFSPYPGKLMINYDSLTVDTLYYQYFDYEFTLLAVIANVNCIEYVTAFDANENLDVCEEIEYSFEIVWANYEDGFFEIHISSNQEFTIEAFENGAYSLYSINESEGTYTAEWLILYNTQETILSSYLFFEEQNCYEYFEYVLNEQECYEYSYEIYTSYDPGDGFFTLIFSSENEIDIQLSAYNVSYQPVQVVADTFFNNGEEIEIYHWIYEIDYDEDSMVEATINYLANDCQDNFSSTFDFTLVPLELINFKVETSSLQNTVYWQTASAVDEDYFILQHSANGVNFTDLAKIETINHSSGIEHYSYLHNSKNCSNYYRLQSVGLNGIKQVISDIISAENCYDNKPTVYPTITGGLVYCTNCQGQQIQLFNALGKKLKLTNNSSNTIDLSNYPSGQYFVVIGESATKIIKP